MNQYDEELRFTFVDDDVPKRGLTRSGSPDSDQFVVTLDYQQKIAQVAAEDRPDSGGLAAAGGLPIHHEPGLWLRKLRPRTRSICIPQGHAIDPAGKWIALRPLRERQDAEL
jgi:hypothetical protein